MRSTRPSREDIFFQMAEALAQQATCPRAHVGCLIVGPLGTIVGGGYNTSYGMIPTCEEAGCLIEGGHCVRTVHAEIQALALAARSGIRLDGCSAYCTLLPCITCLQALAVAGVNDIYYDRVYTRDEKIHLFSFAAKAGVHLRARRRA